MSIEFKELYFPHFFFKNKEKSLARVEIRELFLLSHCVFLITWSISATQMYEAIWSSSSCLPPSFQSTSIPILDLLTVLLKVICCNDKFGRIILTFWVKQKGKQTAGFSLILWFDSQLLLGSSQRTNMGLIREIKDVGKVT